MLEMPLALRNRRAVLDGLARILETTGLEELFAGPDEEAVFLYDLLVETSRARSSAIYWEICRTARRRRVTPEYIIDRAVVLLSAMAERRRTDLYRILGVPALASAEVLRHRWLEIAKREHPDAGGEGAAFRRAKEAYEVLRDASRRAEYERFWVRALGPFERVAPTDEGHPETAYRPLLTARPVRPAQEHVVLEVREQPPPPAAPEPPATGARALLHSAARLLAERDALERRLAAAGEGGLGVLGMVARLEEALGRVGEEELDRLRRDVARQITLLESVRTDLARLATLKHALSPRRPSAAGSTQAVASSAG